MSTLTLLLQLVSHVPRRRRLQFGALLVLTLVGSVAEVISLAAVVPFVAVVIDPVRLLDWSVGRWAMAQWGAGDPAQLLAPLAGAFATAAVLAGGVRLLLVWAGLRLGNAVGADLSIEVFRRTMYQPYAVHVARHSGEIISAISYKVGAATTVLISAVTVLTSGGLLVAILATLVALDPILALASAGIFGAAYVGVAVATRRRLSTNSLEIARLQTVVVTTLQEGLGAIREVLLLGAQPMHVEVHGRAVRDLLQATARNSFINQAPRFVMEALALVLVAGLALVAGAGGRTLSGVLPLLGAFALGAQRLLPLLQLLYGHWSTVVGSRAALLETLALLDQPVSEEATRPQPAPLPLTRDLRLDAVRFQYQPDGPWVLDGVSLVVPRGGRVGIAGVTGSGKSTLLDVLVGLLSPTAGQVLVDGVAITEETRRAWQQAIAHVPQSVYLLDATIGENIAFGVRPADIQWARVREAAQRARIAEFIEGCPEGYATRVGERGVRLSGGQRQRIAIARALYRQAAVLVFDEATSALDGATEDAVMSAIEGLERDVTILMVAHRLSTLRFCDVVVTLENGRLTADAAAALPKVSGA